MSNDTLRAGYFGKLPAHSDFVRSASHHVLAELLDQWLAQVMQRLAASARWRQHYDDLAPLHFAFLGTRSRRVVVGHLRSSSDQSQRRFPFACMAEVPVADGAGLLRCGAHALAPLWATLARMAGGAAAAGQPEPLALPDGAPDLAAAAQALDEFLQCETVLGLSGQLEGVPVRQLMLAVGLLLEGLRKSGAPPLRCLALPLPRDTARQADVASLWLALVHRMCVRSDLELGLYLTSLGVSPALVLAFDGANPAALHAIIDPEVRERWLVDWRNLDWVEQALAGRPALQRLALCLEQGQMALGSAVQLFHETFP